MSAANGRERIKNRWTDAELIAGKLGLTKAQAYNHLMSKIIENNWLEGAKEGRTEILESIKALPEFARATAPTIRVHNEEEPRRKSSSETCETVDDCLRVAFWFIRKIGSLEKAKVALDIAGQAMTKMEKKT